jgi:hypothetical protein
MVSGNVEPSKCGENPWLTAISLSSGPASTEIVHALGGSGSSVRCAAATDAEGVLAVGVGVPAVGADGDDDGAPLHAAMLIATRHPRQEAGLIAAARVIAPL